MAQQRETPIYWDQHATKWNLTLIFSVVVAVLGIFMQAVLLIILGLGMAAYSWLTTPRQFLLYRDSMVIVYGIPRTRVISLAEISHVELLSLPLGERLRIRMVSGSRMMLTMRDPGAFRGHLDDALARYHGEQTGSAYVDGAILARGGDPDAEPFLDDVREFDGERYTDEMYEQEPETETYEREYESPEVSGSSGTYTEADEAVPSAAEDFATRVEESPRTSGSYTENPEPDFSGEGRPMYDAGVELETTRTEEEPPEAPRSPY